MISIKEDSSLLLRTIMLLILKINLKKYHKIFFSLQPNQNQTFFYKVFTIENTMDTKQV